MSGVQAPALSVLSAAGVCRVPGAAEALAALLAERRRMAFRWGVHDCCMFAAEAIRVQTGIDPARNLRGRYATALQAARVVQACGGLLAIGSAALGEPLRAPLLACSGDLGMVNSRGPDGEPVQVLAVCIGEWWQVPVADGLALRPLSDGLMAWRVGCG